MSKGIFARRQRVRTPFVPTVPTVLTALFALMTACLPTAASAEAFAELSCAKAGAGAAHAGRIVIDETVSALHPVLEADWLELLQNRVREADALGLFAARRREQAERLKRHADRPVEMMLPVAKAESVREEVIFPARRWLGLAEAARAVVAGFSRTYVFINADDARQRQWLVSYVRGLVTQPAVATAASAGAALMNLRIVVTGGSLSALAEALRPVLPGVRLWADQGGVLVRRFHVTAVPAVAALAARPAWADDARRIRASEVVLTVRTMPPPATDESPKDDVFKSSRADR